MQKLIPIAEQIAAILIERRQTVAVSESSTGGLISAALLIPLAAQERIDLKAVNQIRAAATDGKVMDHLFFLTDVYGPRLSNSTNYFQAADWAVQQLRAGEAGSHGKDDPGGDRRA